MLYSIKKYISENTGILIRLDDIAENMNWPLMKKCELLFDKYNIKPLLGVIPGNLLGALFLSHGQRLILICHVNERVGRNQSRVDALMITILCSSPLLFSLPCTSRLSSARGLKKLPLSVLS